MDENAIGRAVVGAAIAVHRELDGTVEDRVRRLNFDEVMLKHGITRAVNGPHEEIVPW